MLSHIISEEDTQWYCTCNCMAIVAHKGAFVDNTWFQKIQGIVGHPGYFVSQRLLQIKQSLLSTTDC